MVRNADRVAPPAPAVEGHGKREFTTVTTLPLGLFSTVTGKLPFLVASTSNGFGCTIVSEDWNKPQRPRSERRNAAGIPHSPLSRRGRGALEVCSAQLGVFVFHTKVGTYIAAATMVRPPPPLLLCHQLLTAQVPPWAHAHALSHCGCSASAAAEGGGCTTHNTHNPPPIGPSSRCVTDSRSPASLSAYSARRRRSRGE